MHFIVSSQKTGHRGLERISNLPIDIKQVVDPGLEASGSAPRACVPKCYTTLCTLSKKVTQNQNDHVFKAAE